MTPELAVAERIVALETSAGERVYMLKLPQYATMPAVRVQLIDDPTEYHLRGGMTYGRARVQVDAIVDEPTNPDAYDGAQDLAAEIHGDDTGSGLSAGLWTSPGSPDFRVIGSFRVDRGPAYSSDEFRQVGIRQDYMVHYVKG